MASDVLPEAADGRVFGHFINDDGTVVFGLTHGDASFSARLVIWTAATTKTLELEYGGEFPILFKDLQPLAGEESSFILKGAMKVDDSDHGAVVHQAYRLTGKGRLRRLWSVDTSRWVQREPFIGFSPDGSSWGAMADGVEGELHFAFGKTKSTRVKRRETLAFEEPGRGEPEFLYLSSDGPLLLAPHADDIYLLRFTDLSVDSHRIDQLRPVRAAYGGPLFLVRWQAEDRVLWGNDGKEWTAWDLWDLGLSGFPDEPFLRHESASGEPHPARGFVRKAVADGRYRVEHSWRDPRIEHLAERHLSEWQPGIPVSLSVSANGRHAVAVEEAMEQGDGEEKRIRRMRRFELRPLPPMASPRRQTKDAVEP